MLAFSMLKLLLPSGYCLQLQIHQTTTTAYRSFMKPKHVQTHGTPGPNHMINPFFFFRVPCFSFLNHVSEINLTGLTKTKLDCVIMAGLHLYVRHQLLFSSQLLPQRNKEKYCACL